MRRLLRHAFTVCSAISLVLCVWVVLWPAWPVYTSEGSIGLPLGRTQRRTLVYVRELPGRDGPRLVYSPSGLLIAITAGLLAVPPIVWCAMRIRDASRRAARLCVACGYDLRASPERCPECGTAVTG